MRQVNYQNDAHKELAQELVSAYQMAFVEAKTVDDSFDPPAMHDQCWLNRFMAQISRRENWDHFKYSRDDLLNIVKYSYRLPGAFKQPVHGRTS